MPGWECGIGTCGQTFADLESLLAHQVGDHEHIECSVCGTVVPDGYFAIHHAVEEHTRAEYARYYDADSDDIRLRETLKEDVEELVDVAELRERLEEEPDRSADGTPGHS